MDKHDDTICKYFSTCAEKLTHKLTEKKNKLIEDEKKKSDR